MDLRQCNPEGDALPTHKITIANLGKAFRIYNEQGEARADILKQAMKNAFKDAQETQTDAFDIESFKRELLQLVERYSPQRGAAHNKAILEKFKQEWATPRAIREGLAKILNIQHELFSHPLNHSRSFRQHWSYDKRDEYFGSKYDAYSWNWWSQCFMTPETSEFELHRSVKHAIIAARTAPAELPIYTIAFLPIMERAYADLLDDPAVLPLYRNLRKSRFVSPKPRSI